MSQSEKNRLYNKYLTGDISAEDLHTLNKYALDDDFLFDAIEGVSNHDKQSKSSIEDLRQRLSKTRQKKRRPLYLWLSAAASVAIIIFALVWIPEPQNEKISDVVIETSGASEAPVEGDQITIESNEVDSEERIESTTANVTDLENKAMKEKTPPEQIATQEIPAREETQTTDDRSTLSLEEAAPEPLADREQEAEPSTISIQSEKPAPSVPSAAAPEMVALQEESEILKADETSSELSRDRSAEDVTEKESFDLGQSRESISTVAKKRSKMNAFALPNQAKTLEIIIQDDQVNSRNFYDFVVKNIDFEAADAEIVANFTLDNSGLVDSVKITASDNSSLDDKVIRLIESFQNWEGSGNKKVRFRFNKE